MRALLVLFAITACANQHREPAPDAPAADATRCIPVTIEYDCTVVCTCVTDGGLALFDAIQGAQLCGDVHASTSPWSPPNGQDCTSGQTQGHFVCGDATCAPVRDESGVVEVCSCE